MVKVISSVLMLAACHAASAFAQVSNASACACLEGLGADIGISGDVHYSASTVSAHALNLTGVEGTNDIEICRITGSIAYGDEKNNTLHFEVWLPESSEYNGRYLSVGNGGFAGVIDYSAMVTNLNSGYAVGGGDSGHNTSQNGPTKPGGYVDFMNNEDETRAWIQNSIAMFTDPAKKLTTAYYQEPPKKMYYVGCSTGGAQGFALAQYHPEIFDGIVAGSPGNWYSHLILSFLWNGMNSNYTDSFMDQQALDFIGNAVLAECDAIDGVTDGLIENPENCDFDISSLQCSTDQQPVADNTTVCLTSAQIDNAKLFYAGPTRNDTGASIYPGFAVGSESEWMSQESSLWIEYGIPILQNLVFKNLSYDYTQFDWASDVDLVDHVASPLIAEISANLTSFHQRGGKLIVTQGWADPYNAPTWPIEHRSQMQDVFGDELDNFFGLFMVPGGGHCGGAESYPQMPATWHALEALVPWVEEQSIPQAILASDPADGSNSTRKLCPYPQNAVYNGGDTGDWESYTCQ